MSTLLQTINNDSFSIKKMEAENNLSTTKLSFKEDLARFCESPDRVQLKKILESHLGEFSYLDFKENWPSISKIARHILALANSGGGCIIIGVSDKTLEPAGIEELKDKKKFTETVYNFLPSPLRNEKNVGCLDFRYDDSEYTKIIGKKFQVIPVQSDDKYLPFVSMKDGDGILKNRIYT
ncbi:MAG: ATP-binding protein [Crocosphaera sp.]|nr:ATP-binding protein [Crocosphaera sp.]